MQSIAPELSNRLRDVLKSCGSFDNDRELKAVFVDSRIVCWRDGLPECNSTTERIDAIIDYLIDKYNENRENALVLFLQVLSERYVERDACQQQLAHIVIDFQHIFSAKKVFISYKRHAQPDHDLALHLYQAGTQRGYQVFIDQTMRTGVDWLEEIDQQIKNSDYLIVLVSKESMGSEMLSAELKRAYDYRQAHGYPVILPVRIVYEGQLPFQIELYLGSIQHAIWRGRNDNQKVERELIAAIEKISVPFVPASPADSYFDPSELPVPTGPVPLDDEFYIRRKVDARLENQMKKLGTLTTIRAPRQTGKSSLLLRGVHFAKQYDARTVYFDLQSVSSECLKSRAVFLKYLAELIVKQLNLEITKVAELWQDSRDPQENLTNLMNNYVLPNCETRLVLAMDEVDRLLQTSFHGDFFALLRAWYNSIPYDEMHLWEKLNIIMVISTEPHLLIPDTNQSPFNVGLKLYLEDFDIQQVRELNQRHNVPLTEDEVLNLMSLLEGHPYLTRKALYTITTEEMNWQDFVAMAPKDDGPFGDHLRHYHWLLHDEPDLKETLIEIGKYEQCSDEMTFYRLLRAGLTKGRGNICQYRCELYAIYFKEKFMASTMTLDVEDFFVVGGTLMPDAPSYVTRQADDELLQAITRGEYSNVLTARQMGKSSLMVRTVQHLRNNNYKTVIIDLTKLGTQASKEQWYMGLISHFKNDLKLTIDEIAWWQEHPLLSEVNRFLEFLQQVVLQQIFDPIIVFIDEIDSTLSLSFTDDFFVAIRSIYNQRANDPTYKNLTFVLLGVARPGDLIKDKNRTPYNIATSITIRDFSVEQSKVLLNGLEVAYPEQAEVILDRVLYWTGGHPYLTQKLCSEIVATNSTWNSSQIDTLVMRSFLTEEARKEDNLQFVRDWILNNSERDAMLEMYCKIWSDVPIADDELSIIKSQLKLGGLVKSTTTGFLKVRNRIYAQIFNDEWLSEFGIVCEQSPEKKWRRLYTIVIILLLLIIAWYTLKPIIHPMICEWFPKLLDDCYKHPGR